MAGTTRHLSPVGSFKKEKLSLTGNYVSSSNGIRKLPREPRRALGVGTTGGVAGVRNVDASKLFNCRSHNGEARPRLERPTIPPC
jgi:hypothetical protein